MKKLGLSNKVEVAMRINSSALISVFFAREIESFSHVFESQDDIIKSTWVAAELFFLK